MEQQQELIPQVPMEPMKRITLGTEASAFPLALLDSEEIFSDVLSPDVWDQISPEDRKKLRSLLPGGSEVPESEGEALAKSVLNPRVNFFFGSPLNRGFQKLKDGWLNAEGPCEARQLRDNARLAYDHMIRRYHIDLLKKLLTSRRKLLEATSSVPVTERPRLPVPSSPQEVAKWARNDRLRRRAAKRSRMMLTEVSQGAGDSGGVSSDDDDLLNVPQKLVVGAVGEPTLNAPGVNDLHLYQPLEPGDLSSMLREYRSLKAAQPDHPVLELSDIQLEDVIERAGLDQMAEKVGLPVKHPSRTVKRCFPSPSAAIVLPPKK